MTDGMRAVLATTTEQLYVCEAEIRRLMAQADALRRVKSGIEDYLKTARADIPLPSLEGDGEPRGKEAVRRVMAERPGYRWNVTELSKAILEHGWIAANDRVEDAVRTNLGRAMAAFPEIRRAGRGFAVYEPPMGTTEARLFPHVNGNGALQDSSQGAS